MEEFAPPVFVLPVLVRLAPFGPIGRVVSVYPLLRHLPAMGSQLLKVKEEEEDDEKRDFEVK